MKRRAVEVSAVVVAGDGTADPTARPWGMTMTGIPMTVTSTVGARAGSTYAEGTAVCDFTRPAGGAMVIEPDQ